MAKKLNNFMKKKSLEEAVNQYPNYKKFLKECIKKGKGEIIIDWVKIQREDFENTIEDIKQMASYVLHDMGIMSAESKGNYQVIGAGVSLNPSFLYFTKEKDAIDYKKAFFGGAQYKINISKLID